MIRRSLLTRLKLDASGSVVETMRIVHGGPPQMSSDDLR
jgi:hypothetical protein